VLANENVISAINLNFTDPTLALRFAERNYREFPESPVAVSKFYELLIDEQVGKSIRRLEIGKYDSIKKENDIIKFTCFSADGNRIVGITNTKTEQKHVKLWDEQGRCLDSIHVASVHENPILALAISPDGNWVLTGSDDKTAKLWEFKEGKFTLSKILGGREGHRKGITSVAFSTSGDSLATGSWDNKIILWKKDGTPLRSFYEDVDNLSAMSRYNRISALAFSADGKYLFSGYQSGRVVAWQFKDSRSYHPKYRYKGLRTEVTQLAIAKDGQKVLACTAGKRVMLWDLNGKKKELLNLVHLTDVICIAFTPESDKILTGLKNNQVKVWHAGNGKETLTLIGHESLLNSIFTNGHDVFTADEKGMVRQWELHGLKEEHVFDELHKKNMSAVNITPDGTLLLTGADSLKCWELVPDEDELTLTKPAKTRFRFEADISAIASTNQFAYIGLQNGQMIIWDLKKRTINKSLTGHQKFITSIAISPDEELILTGSRDYTAILWDKEGTPLDTLTHERDVNAVAFSPTGDTLVTGSKNDVIKIWSTKKDRLFRKLKCGQGAINSIAFSPNGRYLFTGADGSGKLWDLETDKLPGEDYEYVEYKSDFNPMAFFPNGELILGSSERGKASIWDLNGRKLKLSDYDLGSIDIKYMNFLSEGSGFFTASGKEVKIWISPFYYLEHYVEKYSGEELEKLGENSFKVDNHELPK